MSVKKTLLIVFGSIFGLFVLIIGSIFVFFFMTVGMPQTEIIELHKKRSAETSGTITSVSQFRSKGDKYSGSTFNSTFTFQYSVNGTTFEQKKQTSGSESDPKKSGLKVKVCYDPADPQSADFYYLEDNKTCAVSLSEK